LSFAATLATHGTRTALVEDTGRSISYRELADLAASLGDGVGRGPRLVAVACTNRIDAVAGYLAALAGGHAALLFDPSLPASMREGVLARYAVDTLWTPTGSGNEYALVRLRERPTPFNPALSLLLSTSGSTGSHKLVRLARENLDANASAIAAYLGLDESERPITTLPIHYSYGLSVLNSHLHVGATSLLTDQSVTSRAFWDFFRAQSATSIAGVPYTYEMLHRLRFERMSLPSLRTLTQAGGRLAPDLVRHFAQLAAANGRRFFVMYGQTEAAPRMAYLPPELAAAHPDSIGYAVPGGRFSLKDDSGAAIESADTVGELVFSGPNVMLGYADDMDDLGRGDEMHGTLATGDLAVRDAQGLYYLRGRKSRFAKLFGNRIGFDEVEALLAEHDIISAVAGDDACLRVAVERGTRALAESLLHRRLNLHPSVTRVRTVSALPRNASGKVRYGDVVALVDAAP
jgi:long-chain acyl-CoA synthetase